jgi:hypothetical protein
MGEQITSVICEAMKNDAFLLPWSGHATDGMAAV